MTGLSRQVAIAALACGLLRALPAPPQEVKFTDPTGDDNGPGKYTYPTDPVFVPGAFDLTGFRLKAHGDRVDLEVNLAAKLSDPWKTGSGFSLQMIFIFVQTVDRSPKPAAAGAAAAGAGAAAGGGTTPQVATGTEGGATSATSATSAPSGGASVKATAPAGAAATTASTAKGAAKPAPKPPPGITQGLPGLNVQFAPEQAWDRCIILAPDLGQLRQEIEAKVPAALRAALVVPEREKGSGHTIEASVERKALGAGSPKDWGFQVVVASYDPYPARDSLLVRPVDHAESEFRFGGAENPSCDPNVLDVLAGNGDGEDGEIGMQHTMLEAECKPGTPAKLASLQMVRIKKELTREEKRAKRKQEEEEKKKAKEEGKPATGQEPPPGQPPPAQPPPSGQAPPA